MKKESCAFLLSVVFGIAFLGFSRDIGWALNKGFMFTLLSSYTSSPFIKGVILSLEGGIGLIIPPLVGWYSDRVFTKMGRRKPFILIGGILAGISIYFSYLFYLWNLPLASLVCILSFFYFSMHLYTAPYRALMPDLIESGKRGIASGIITIFEVVGNLVGFIVGSVLWNIDKSYPFIMGAFLIPLASIITFAVIKEKELGKEDLKNIKEESVIKYAKKMFSEKDTIKFYTAQTLWWMAFEFIAIFFVGIAAQIIYGSATKENIEKVTGSAVMLMGIFNLAAIFSALPGGIIYDKIGRKISMIAGSLIFGFSILAGFIVTNYIQILIVLLIAGIGWGMLLAASYPVIGDLLTKFRREKFNGRYYGVFEASRSLPILLGGVFGGGLVSLFKENYIILFPASATFIFISIPIVLSMKKLEE